MTLTLILGTCYVDTEEMEDVVDMWARLVRKLNPECDVLLVDSASPVKLSGFLPRLGYNCLCPMPTPEHLTGTSERVIGFFPDNIGHLSRGGRDGWGRALSAGIDYAVRQGYTHLAYIDADILLARPVQPILDKMIRTGVKIACPLEPQYLMVENGIIFADVAYLRDSKFIERYDWENPPTDGRLPENRFEDLVSDELFLLPLRGLRNDFGAITPQNVGRAPDWITHASSEVYAAFLKVNGIKL